MFSSCGWFVESTPLPPDKMFWRNSDLAGDLEHATIKEAFSSTELQRFFARQGFSDKKALLRATGPNKQGSRRHVFALVSVGTPQRANTHTFFRYSFPTLPSAPQPGGEIFATIPSITRKHPDTIAMVTMPCFQTRVKSSGPTEPCRRRIHGDSVFSPCVARMPTSHAIAYHLGARLPCQFPACGKAGVSYAQTHPPLVMDLPIEYLDGINAARCCWTASCQHGRRQGCCELL